MFRFGAHLLNAALASVAAIFVVVVITVVASNVAIDGDATKAAVVVGVVVSSCNVFIFD